MNFVNTVGNTFPIKTNYQPAKKVWDGKSAERIMQSMKAAEKKTASVKAAIDVSLSQKSSKYQYDQSQMYQNLLDTFNKGFKNCKEIDIKITVELLANRWLSTIPKFVVDSKSAMKVCKEACNISSALDVILEMQEKNIVIDDRTFNKIKNTCAKNIEFTFALIYFKKMQKAGFLKPDIITHASIIDVCIKASGLASDFFRQLQNPNVKISRQAYNKKIDTCVKAKKFPKAFRLFEKMQKEGIKPNFFTYDRLLEACQKSNDSTTALKLFEQMNIEDLYDN